MVLSVEEFRRLKALDTRRAYHPAELPEGLRAALDTAEAPAWTARFDDELTG